MNDSSKPSRTDVLVAAGEARNAETSKSIADNKVALRRSRDFLAGRASVPWLDTHALLCAAIADEMDRAGNSPTAEQLKAWREVLRDIAKSGASQELIDNADIQPPAARNEQDDD